MTEHPSSGMMKGSSFHTYCNGTGQLRRTNPRPGQSIFMECKKGCKGTGVIHILNGKLGAGPVWFEIEKVVNYEKKGTT